MMPKALVLAGGRGERLRPLTDRLPKVMVPVHGKPILQYHIEQLARDGIKDIFINLHHLPDVIRNYFLDGSRWGVEIRYSFEPEILGTAGAVKKLEKELAGGPFLVIYGDNYIEVDYRDFIGYSEGHGAMATIAVFEKDDVQGSGILEINAKAEIRKFVEKPRPDEVFSHWVNAGVFYFRTDILAFLEKKYSDFGYDIFPKLLQSGKRLVAYKLKTPVWAIDSPELLQDLTDRLHNDDVARRP